MIKKRKVEVLYLAVTADDLELPIGVFDTIKEVVKYAHCSYGYAKVMVHRQSIHEKLKCKFIRVEIGGFGKNEKI